MTISKGSANGREACRFTLAVDRYDAQNMECIVYEGNEEQGFCCHSFIELAWRMEQGFEKMDYPTPSVQKRRFSSRRPTKTDGQAAQGRLVSGRRDGGLGTFRIWVRQYFYATWQGEISREEDGQECLSFENFLEFVNILDGLLTGCRLEPQEEEGLAGSLAKALLLAGKYDGIWVGGRDASGVLFCGRDLKDGKQESFMVRPMFRENHTYQGSVCWMEGRQQKNFRSFLELLFLIMSASEKRISK